jgi:hypothetical protein
MRLQRKLHNNTLNIANMSVPEGKKGKQRILAVITIESIRPSPSPWIASQMAMTSCHDSD